MLGSNIETNLQNATYSFPIKNTNINQHYNDCFTPLTTPWYHGSLVFSLTINWAATIKTFFKL